MDKYINTLDYGYLQIRYDRGWMQDELVDIIEDIDGEVYEVRKNINGKLVALEV